MLADLKLPPPKRQLELELDKYETLIKQIETEGKKAEETAVMWNEVVTRKALYDQLVGRRYITPAEVSPIEKRAIIETFRKMQGFSWSRNQGWTGQAKVLKKPEIAVFEAKTGTFECLSITSIKLGNITKGTITGINLNGNGCDGPIPSEFGNLESAEYVDFGMNLVRGSLPQTFGKLASVRRLCLRGNLFEGELHGNILARLVSLTELDLSSNQFSGNLPDIFDSFAGLVELNISGNRFCGNLPSSLQFASKLRVLKACQNDFEGPLPTWFQSLSRLKELNLSQNRFSGDLLCLSTCTRLEKLQLDHNDLTGEMNLLDWSKFTALEILYLQRNRLCGELPSSLVQLRKLKRINLSFNCIRGLLPENIGDLAQLESLVLTGNEFVGPVPRSLANLSKLRDFHVFRDYPAENSGYPRGFSRKVFERVYAFGPAAQVNSVCWDPVQVYGPPPEKPPTPPPLEESFISSNHDGSLSF